MSQKTNQGAKLLEDFCSPSLTQAELAKKLEVTPQAINNFIRGRSKPSRELANKIAKVTGVPVDAWDKAACRKAG